MEMDQLVREMLDGVGITRESYEDAPELYGRLVERLIAVMSEEGIHVDILNPPTVQPYGCKCGENERLVEGAHLSTCPHYSDEGIPPGFPVGNRDPEARGPFPAPH